MKKLWDTIDRWGPGAISLLTLAAMIALAWIYSSRLSYQQGRIEGLENALGRQNQQETSLHQEIQTWQAYIIVLQKRLIESGIEVPDSPKGGER